MASGTSFTIVATPLRATVCGLPGALSVIESVPASFPSARGTKVTVMVQLDPAGRDEPQLSVSLKFADAAMLVILRVAVPSLLSVRADPALVVPTSWVPKSRRVDDNVAFGPASTGYNRTETTEPTASVTARSSRPSLLKSPRAMEEGLVPAAWCIAGWNVPSPLPMSTLTALGEMLGSEEMLETAKSSLPSPLKSPKATKELFHLVG